MIPYPDLIRAFLHIGLMSFGGPAAQIGLMYRVLVDERKWLSEQQYLNALGFCMLLPGPEAMQLCTYAGWKLRGVPGGLIAGALFVLPGAFLIVTLAALYSAYGTLTAVQAMFLGIKAAVLVIVFDALIKISKRALTTTLYRVIAGASFVCLFFLDFPFPLIIAAAGALGFMRAAHRTAPTVTGHISWRNPALILLGGALVWLAPLAIIHDPFLYDIAAFFGWLAIVTFGGAYAVLAYMAQAVVSDFGWLDPAQMIDGLGLAETTPGPLILVTQFTAFIAGHTQGGMTLALTAAVLSLWMTFVPCFVWILAGAPLVDRLSETPRLSGALRAVTAAVVGVILNLSLWFALHALFGTVERVTSGPLTLWWPDVSRINWVTLSATALAAALILWRRTPLGWALAICAAFTWGASTLFG